jgi:hypothetical protein
MRASGFVAEAEKAEQGLGGDSLTDSVLETVCLIGPAARCRERLTVYRGAGLDMPIPWPAIGVEDARAVIAAFRQ